MRKYRTFPVARLQSRRSTQLSVICAAAIVISPLLGCSSSSLRVTGTRIQSDRPLSTVYVVSHGGESRGVDASIQADLFRRGYVVTTGPEGSAPKDADLLVRFTESWSWDFTMYLKAASILCYDGRTGTLIASGDWRNGGGLGHGWPSTDSIVARILDSIVQKTGLRATAPAA